jgi:hypothetical protein
VKANRRSGTRRLRTISSLEPAAAAQTLLVGGLAAATAYALAQAFG